MRKKRKLFFLIMVIFILFLSKNFLYGLFIPHSKVILKSISKYPDELKDLIKDQNYYYGKILYQNPYKFNEELVIAVDTTNLNKNDYVINENGLVGIIDKTYKNKAIVKLLTASDIMMQVKVNNCYGILSFDKKVIVKNIGIDCKVDLKDKVYTSNLGYINEEVYIGKIKEIIFDQNEITNDYVVDLDKNKYTFSDYVVVISRDIS